MVGLVHWLLDLVVVLPPKMVELGRCFSGWICSSRRISFLSWQQKSSRQQVLTFCLCDGSASLFENRYWRVAWVRSALLRQCLLVLDYGDALRRAPVFLGILELAFKL